MRIWVLGSGSAGNCVLLDCDGTRVLIDAGFSPSTLQRRLAGIGVAPESVEAVIVTHEHSDHVRGAAASVKRWGWSVYATAGTMRQMPALCGPASRTIVAGQPIAIGALRIEPVAVSHDAAEPVALVATAAASGVRVGVVYDLGSTTAGVRTALCDLDLLVLEANHDDTMLACGPYPRFVRERIAGRHGHLSNREAAMLARTCAHRGLQHVVLAHISQNCNRPQLAASAVSGALASTAFRGRIHTASQDTIVGPFIPGTGRRSAALQLALPF